MFSSKALSERNSDPTPVVWDGHGATNRARTDTNAFRSAARGLLVLDDYQLDPRPEYQHGKLPANPILVEIRAGRHLPINRRSLQTELGWLSAGAVYPDETPEQIIHANRVLTLLATLTESSI